MVQKFIYYPRRPKNLTAAFAKKEYDKLLGLLPAAEASQTPELWMKLFADWNALQAYISGEACRIAYAYSKDKTNKTLESAERYLREKVSPAIDKPEHHLAQAFVASKHRKAIAKRYGQQLIPVYETALKPLDPINTSLYIKLGNLSSRYEKITASAKIKLAGKTLNLSEIRALQFSDDAAIRESAYRASAQWFLKNRDRLAGIYNTQVKLRHQMGLNLGYENYIPLAYMIRGRQGYGETEVAAFRKLVLKYIVPLYKKIAENQAKAIGSPSLRPWDIFYSPKLSIPLGSVPVDRQLKNAQTVFNKLSPVLGAHFKNMRDNSLIDLETRPNKQANPFCMPFFDENKVAILCNSTGDPDDVRVLTHEMGHAFQFWESHPIEAIELQVGTAELAEIYSMGMEFLALPYVENFFNKENAKKFAQYKWIDGLYLICYACVIDEFQHWVYKNPEASLQRRDEIWSKLSAMYLLFIDYSGLEKYASIRWYAQQHIFTQPFYYIDYALAETCAMQLGMLAAKDHKKTVKKYLQMCKIGGSKSFLAAVSSSGLRSPFDDGLIMELKKEAEEILL